MGNEYVSNVPDPTWAREQSFRLKLRVAHGSLFPFFVVGTDHFEDLSRSIKLTLVDGIIGEVLAKRAAHDQFNQGFVPEEAGWPSEAFETLALSEQHEIIQDWVIGVEVEADFAMNPIYGETGRLHQELGYGNTRREFVQYPPLPDGLSVEERIQRIHSCIRQGSRVTVKTKFGEATRTVMLPNFKTPMFSGLGLTEELATLLALEDIRRRNAAA